jgi:hypothetical protein
MARGGEVAGMQMCSHGVNHDQFAQFGSFQFGSGPLILEFGPGDHYFQLQRRKRGGKRLFRPPPPPRGVCRGDGMGSATVYGCNLQDIWRMLGGLFRVTTGPVTPSRVSDCSHENVVFTKLAS